MRKTPVHKDNRPTQEILDECTRGAFVLHRDKGQSGQAATAKQRLKLLKQYLEVAQSGVAGLGNASKWYLKAGFPGFLGKDYKKGQLTRPIEVVLPIALAADSLKRLVAICEAWKTGDTEYLLNQMVEVPLTHDSVASRVSSAADPDEQESRNNREANVRIIRELQALQGEKKYHRRPQTNVGGQLNADFTAVNQGKKMGFHEMELAWFADYETFTAKRIQPFEMKSGAPDSAELLAFAEDQLIKAANIMLRGIQPTVIANRGGHPCYRYHLLCDWHVIAKAFAELVTNTELCLEPKECEVCKTDISNLDKRAKKCRECSSKKRKPKS